MAKADKSMGDMGVGGSNSVKVHISLCMKAGYHFRLITTTAQIWNVSVNPVY